MTSDAQLAANRRNSHKSTGPKTQEGKAAASRNSIRHGLCSAQLILFDERQEDFEIFIDELRAAHAPADPAEDAVVERLALAQWRLRRVWRAEAAAFNREALDRAQENARQAARERLTAEIMEEPPEGKTLNLNEARNLAWHTIGALSNAQIEEMMMEGVPEDRERPPPPLEVWPVRLEILSRHEASLERTLNRLMRELQQLQARRHDRLGDALTAKLRREHAAEMAEAKTADRSQAEAAETETAERSQFRGGAAAAPPAPPAAAPAFAHPFDALTTKNLENEANRRKGGGA